MNCLAAFALAAACASAVSAQQPADFEPGATLSSLRGQSGPAPASAGKNVAAWRDPASSSVLPAHRALVLDDGRSRHEGDVALQPVAGSPSRYAFGGAFGDGPAVAGRLELSEGGALMSVSDAAGQPLGAIRAQGSAAGRAYTLLDPKGGFVARAQVEDGGWVLRDAQAAPLARLAKTGDRWELLVDDSLDPRLAVILTVAVDAGPADSQPAAGAAEPIAPTPADSAPPAPGAGSPGGQPAGPPPPSPDNGERAPSLFNWVGARIGEFFDRLMGRPPPVPQREPDRPPRTNILDTTAPTGPLIGDPLSRPTVRDGQIRDALGRQILMRGINISERSKHPPFSGWLRPQDADAVERMGFDHVRFLLTWEAIEPQDGVFDDAYLDEVRRELSWFEARGIYVVLDMHQDQFARRFGGDGMPNWVIEPDRFPLNLVPDVIAPFPLNYFNPKVISNFKAFFHSKEKRARLARAWAHAVSKLKNSKAVIGYDLLNEPFPGITVPRWFEAGDLMDFQKEMTAAIRSEDKDRIIFQEPEPVAAAFPDTGLKPVDPNSVYAPHWYDPLVDLRSFLGIHPTYDGNAQRTANAFDNLAQLSAQLGQPMWLGEYGIERERGGAEQYIQDHSRLLDERLMSSSYWELNPDQQDVFSPIAPDGHEYPIAADLTHPHPRAIAGDLKHFSYDPAKKRLEADWAEGKHAPGAPTLIELPAEAYPLSQPIDVSLSDPAGRWRFERDPAIGRLAIWADPATDLHKLVVTPHAGASGVAKNFTLSSIHSRGG